MLFPNIHHFLFCHICEDFTWLLIQELVIFPSSILKVGLFGHSNENHECDRYEINHRAVDRNCRYKLHAAGERAETDDDFFVLEEKGDG